jgi:enoyl-CoA hydratase
MNLKTDKMVAEKDGGIGWMTFNNPAKRNATSLEMWQAAASILEDFEADQAIRAVVMKGAGDKAFVSGADISEFKEVRRDAEAAASYSKAAEGARHLLNNMRKPLIVMIRGYCLGGGLALAMKADMRIASEDAQLGIPAAKLGIAPGFETLKALVDLVGPAYASEIMFTGRRFSAEEALRIGLVNRIVSIDALEATVRKIANEICNNAPLSIAGSKFTIREVLKDADERNHAAIADLWKICFDSQDFQEGREAFMEKRKPVFKGL